MWLRLRGVVLLIALFLAAVSCKDESVSPETVLVEKIFVQGANIIDGKPKQFEAIVFPETAVDKSVAWSVSNEAIATIAESGLLTPKSNGVVNVKASALDGSEVSGEKQITISGVNEIVTNSIIVSTAAQLINALAAANPGDAIYVRGSIYNFSSKITISRSGNSTDSIKLLAYQGDSRPKFDFSSMTESSSNQGIVLQANYWYIRGIDIYKAGDNGMQIKGGNYNTIEFCTFSECADTGLQIDNSSSYNVILNCDSYYNADSSIENADGFACKLNAGTGNKFIGCRAWQNLDDGWDGYLRGADNISTTYENCWAVRNGYLKNGLLSGGDGNGFKTGGSDDKTLKHNAVYKNCVAAGNAVDGFDHNSNRGEITLYNCAAHNNKTNFGFGSTNAAASLTIKNCAVPGNVGNLSGTVTDITNNSWQDGIVCNNDDFHSIDWSELIISPRKPDGSLPDVLYLHLVSGSDLIDKGVSVGLSFKGTAPDLGAFEFD